MNFINKKLSNLLSYQEDIITFFNHFDISYEILYSLPKLINNNQLLFEYAFVFDDCPCIDYMLITNETEKDLIDKFERWKVLRFYK